jgi:hypothetical protein
MIRGGMAERSERRLVARFFDLVRRIGLSEWSSEAALAPRRMVP